MSLIQLECQSCNVTPNRNMRSLITPTDCTALHCTALHCTVPCCTALHCTTMHCSPVSIRIMYITPWESVRSNQHSHKYRRKNLYKNKKKSHYHNKDKINCTVLVTLQYIVLEPYSVGSECGVWPLMEPRGPASAQGVR